MSFNNVSCTFSHFKALFSLSQFQQKETIALKKRSEKREIICNFYNKSITAINCRHLYPMRMYKW